MNNKFKGIDISSEQENISRNHAHNALIEDILNRDFELSHGYPHPSTVRKKVDINEFLKALDEAIIIACKKSFAKK